MDLVTARRGAYEQDGVPRGARVLLSYMPLSEMLIDFYDQLKSRTRGYASLDYSFWEYRPGDWSSWTSWSTASRSTPFADRATATAPTTSAAAWCTSCAS